MNAVTLLTGYVKNTQALAFRVYLTEIPETARKKQTRLSHLTAHDLLSAALCEDFASRHVKITRTGLEKPVLVSPALHMNLSHCKGFAVCAVGVQPLGVDCETPRKLSERLLRTVCTETECAWIHSQNSAESAFSRIWTLKEAYTKYTGEGIRHPFSALEFSVENGIRFLHPDAERLHFYQLTSEHGTVVSLCVTAGAYDITYRAADWTLTESAAAISS